jgi:hypothetical protein
MPKLKIPSSPLAGAWFAAAAICVGTIATESLPLVFGTGAAARVDWSFLYVTSRFVILPLAALLSLGLSLWAFTTLIRTGARASAWTALSSILIPVCFLGLSIYRPLPWFYLAPP